jgi:hypothetical protein
MTETYYVAMVLQRWERVGLQAVGCPLPYAVDLRPPENGAVGFLSVYRTAHEAADAHPEAQIVAVVMGRAQEAGDADPTRE